MYNNPSDYFYDVYLLLDSENDFCSAVSRLYYCAFHLMREALRKSRTKTANTHKAIRVKYCELFELQENIVLEWYKLRERVDYMHSGTFYVGTEFDKMRVGEMLAFVRRCMANRPNTNVKV